MTDIDEIRAMQTIDALPPDEALEAIASAIDHACDHGDLSLNDRALTWCVQVEARLTSDEQRLHLDYYQANAWANRQMARQTDREAAWAWDQEALQKQVFFLRRARNRPTFDEQSAVVRCQILTNLANQLDTAGRFIEARELWTEALEEEPEFWMARGNRGRALMSYAHSLYDPGHFAIFAHSAHADLVEALRDLDEHPEFGDQRQRPYFAGMASNVENECDLEAVAANYRPDQQALRGNSVGRAYRLWCLQQTLFLNPLNDLGAYPIAARDVLTLPSFVVPLDEPPVLVGFFNQLKQEFVSARWLFFDGTRPKATHLSDRGVLLYNTLDYTALSLAVEKIKIAFRMSYSLLDKIAYFLNHYLKLGIPEKKISFRGIWREKDNGPVRAAFLASENWPFRGLYWLSKDLFEKDYKDMTEPEARELHELRNHLEHKYVKVHFMTMTPPLVAGTSANPFFDNFAHSVSRDDLERRTLRLLKLVRSALIYLSLGMHREEDRRRENAGTDRVVAPMPLTAMKDDWKRRW